MTYPGDELLEQLLLARRRQSLHLVLQRLVAALCIICLWWLARCSR